MEFLNIWSVIIYLHELFLFSKQIFKLTNNSYNKWKLKIYKRKSTNCLNFNNNLNKFKMIKKN